MRIGELAERTGHSRDAIRFYEKQGLIRAATRERGNNYKTYSDEAVLTLEVIRDAQAAGMSIGDLSVFLSQLFAQEAEADFDGDAFLAAKIAETEARIVAARRFLHTLKTTRKALKDAPFP